MKSSSRQVTAADAKANLPTLLKRVQAGERITITYYNKPVADLVPTIGDQKPAPKFATMKGRIKILDPDWHKGPKTNADLAAWLEGKFE